MDHIRYRSEWIELISCLLEARGILVGRGYWRGQSYDIEYAVFDLHGDTYRFEHDLRTSKIRIQIAHDGHRGYDVISAFEVSKSPSDPKEIEGISILSDELNKILGTKNEDL